MRRQLAAAALCLGVAGSALVAPAGAMGEVAAPAVTPATADAATDAQEALEGAEEVLTAGEPAVRAPESAAPEATLALRDLAVALPRLTGEDRERAEALLARPTDGRGDPYGDGYTVPSRRDCATHVCVHWVNRTQDAPPSRRWVTRTQEVLGEVWRTEVDEMGFRRPLGDRRAGGNRRLDVYLAELGGQGIYGYCAPEPSGGRRAPGYCVLDDDFARSQFGRRPIQSLRVTAAHEFLHAVQFGYDYREDPWLLEATATWIEERYADGVDDNRQYLDEGQVGVPAEPLDSRAGLAEYGNWAFFEHLADRFGDGIVRRVWEQAGEARGDGGAYSVQALVRALPGGASLDSVFARYAMALSTPAASFPEGSAWGPAAFVSSRTLGPADTRDGSRSLDHLSSKASRWVPGGGLDTTDWRLRISVEGPSSASAPVAGVVRVLPDGTTERTVLPLDAQGDGQVTVPFNQVQADAVHVVLGNASARYTCHRGAVWACDGVPRDDDRRVRLSVAVVEQS
jgi:hypothetical protein